MKDQHYWPICLLAGLLLACVIPAWNPTSTPEPASTATATPTWTPTVTPSPTAATTPTPTPTMTATPKATPTATRVAQRYVSDVHIQLDDLPDSFIKLDATSLNVDESMLSQGGYQIENLDLFLSASPFETIFTFLVQGKSAADRASFDLLLSNPQIWVNVMPLPRSEIVETEVIDDLPPIGEKASGLRAAIVDAEQTFRLEVTIFRRQLVVGLAAIMYPEEQDPLVPVEKVATLLDGYLEAALEEK